MDVKNKYVQFNNISKSFCSSFWNLNYEVFKTVFTQKHTKCINTPTTSRTQGRKRTSTQSTRGHNYSNTTSR